MTEKNAARDASGGRKPRVDRITLVFVAIAVAAGIAVWLRDGPDVVLETMGSSLALLAYLAPQVLAGLVIGGFVQQLVPREKVARRLGGESGMRGLALACGLGLVTPGGPFTSFPLVYALYVAGADIGALVAYVTAWSLVGVHRVLVFELPFLGPDLAALRFLASLPLPILAGLIARGIGRHPAIALPRTPS
ncbi:permease [Salinarimonas chemoclinalis]|uniref:permease n=1 Tax=Salinarimonas chemoclinalis TaxID=3241599 RepID=UPI003555BE5A